MEELRHGFEPDAAPQVGIFCQPAVVDAPEYPRHCDARVLCHHRSPGHARDAHVELEDEQGAEDDVHHVGDDGDDHRRFGVLHPDEPAVYGEERYGGGCRPDTGEEVFGCECPGPFAALHQPKREPPHGVAQQNEKQGQHDGHGHGTDEDVGTFAQVAGSVGLCRDAARSHAQETARPVYHVEYRRSDADGAYCGGTVAQPARYRRIDHAQQGDGDVGYDVWDGESQYSPVH